METVTVNLPQSGSTYAREVFTSLAFFSRFRYHPGFSPTDIDAINHHDAQSLAATAACGTLHLQGNTALALTAVRALPWESEFFDLRMGRLFLWKAPGLPAERLSGFVTDTLLAASREHGICHVSAEVDIDDYVGLNCLLQQGFEVMDLKRTYFTNAIHHTSRLAKGSAFVRKYEANDHDAVTAIAEQTRFTTRFTRDRHIRPALAEQMYQHWFQRMLDEACKGSNVVVYSRHGQVVACGGIGEMDFQKYGLDMRMRTGSLYASLPSGVGGYGPVLYRLTADALHTHGLVETTVSLNNSTAIRVVEGIRPNRSVTVYCLRKFMARHE